MDGKRVIAVVGGIALAGGSFLQWIELGIAFGLTRTGFDLAVDVYYNWDEVNLADSPLLSAGLITVLLGALGVLGGATRRAPLVRISGILSLLAVGLLFGNLISTNDMMLGYWIVTSGAVLLVLGGFLPDRQSTSG